MGDALWTPLAVCVNRRDSKAPGTYGSRSGARSNLLNLFTISGAWDVSSPKKDFPFVCDREDATHLEILVVLAGVSVHVMPIANAPQHRPRVPSPLGRPPLAATSAAAKNSLSARSIGPKDATSEGIDRASPRSSSSSRSDEDAPTGGGMASSRRASSPRPTAGRAQSPRPTANRALSPRPAASARPPPSSSRPPSPRARPHSSRRATAAEAIDQAHALVALDQEAAHLHEKCSAAEEKVVALEARLQEMEAEREREREESEARFEDMKGFMKGICDGLKQANTELSGRLNELLAATKDAAPSQQMMLKSQMRSMEESLQRLQAENSELRLRAGPPKKSCLKGARSSAVEAMASPTADGVVAADDGDGAASKEVGAVAADACAVSAAADTPDSPSTKAFAEAEAQAEAEAKAEDAVQVPADKDDDNDDDNDDDDDEAAEPARASPLRLSLPLPSLPVIPRLSLGGGTLGGGLPAMSMPALDLSCLAAPAPSVMGERPDEDDRRPPTPPSVIIERIAQAKAEAAAATAAAELQEAKTQEVAQPGVVDAAEVADVAAAEGEIESINVKLAVASEAEAVLVDEKSAGVEGGAELFDPADEAGETASDNRRASFVEVMVDWFTGTAGAARSHE